MHYKKHGFSFVEVIIAVSIIIVIAIIATTSYSGMQDNSLNAKVSSDLKTLENSLYAYSKAEGSLPKPTGNTQNYAKDTSYVHNFEDTETFGVSGYITENTLPKKYLNFVPRDPKTNQYYGYGRLKGKNAFEIAGVLSQNAQYISKVQGNWGGEEGPFNLIKEYAGPGFVSNNSDEYYPYNPKEKILTAHISSASGTIQINTETYQINSIESLKDLSALELHQGDTITTSTGSQANIYYSDGSNSLLGSTNSASQVVLAQMKIKEDNDLFTSVKIALNFGSLWTQASHLGENSDFEVYTADTVAAVRGTIFGVTSSPSASEVNLIEGKVRIATYPENTNISEKIEKNTLTLTNVSLSGVTQISSGESIIEVQKGESPKGISLPKTSTPSINTDIFKNIQEISKDKLLGTTVDLNGNIQYDSSSFTPIIESGPINDIITLSGLVLGKTQGLIFSDRRLETPIRDTSFLILPNVNEYKIFVCERGLDSDGLADSMYQREIRRTPSLQKKYCSQPFTIEIKGNTAKFKKETSPKKYEAFIEKNITGNENVTQTPKKLEIEFYDGTKTPYGSGTRYNDSQKVEKIIRLYQNILEKKPYKDGFSNLYEQSNVDTGAFFMSQNNSPYAQDILDKIKNFESNITSDIGKFQFGFESISEPITDTSSSAGKIHLTKKIPNYLSNEGYIIKEYIPFINTLTGVTFGGKTFSTDMQEGTILQPSNGAWPPIYSGSYFIDASSNPNNNVKQLEYKKFLFNPSNHITLDKNLNPQQTGVFIDNTGSTTYLQYANNNFTTGAIEIEVRGGALTRHTQTKYTLLSTNGNTVHITEKRLCINSECKNIPQDKIEANKTYFIQIISEGSEAKVKIINTDISVSKNTSLNLSDVYIGSEKSSVTANISGSMGHIPRTNTTTGYINQWNDLIYGVKYYSKR